MGRVGLERPVVLFVDLHGHSRRTNIFCYGCDTAHWDPRRNRYHRYRASLNRLRYFQHSLGPPPQQVPRAATVARRTAVGLSAPMSLSIPCPFQYPSATPLPRTPAATGTMRGARAASHAMVGCTPRTSKQPPPRAWAACSPHAVLLSVAPLPYPCGRRDTPFPAPVPPPSVSRPSCVVGVAGPVRRRRPAMPTTKPGLVPLAFGPLLASPPSPLPPRSATHSLP
jgi:hypothetical protein